MCWVSTKIICLDYTKWCSCLRSHIIPNFSIESNCVYIYIYIWSDCSAISINLVCPSHFSAYCCLHNWNLIHMEQEIIIKEEGSFPRLPQGCPSNGWNSEKFWKRSYTYHAWTQWQASIFKQSTIYVLVGIHSCKKYQPQSVDPEFRIRFAIVHSKLFHLKRTCRLKSQHMAFTNWQYNVW